MLRANNSDLYSTWSKICPDSYWASTEALSPIRWISFSLLLLCKRRSNIWTVHPTLARNGANSPQVSAMAFRAVRESLMTEFGHCHPPAITA